MIVCALALAWATVGAAEADASLGELSFLGCLGQLSGCAAVPVGLAGAVEVPKSLVVSPDGSNVYAADEGASTIDVFSRNALSGMLTLSTCVGQHTGCEKTTPEKAVERPEAIAVSPDGENVYAGSVGSNAVVEFSRNPSNGELTYMGCTGQLSGCTHTAPSEAVTGPASIAISPDGKSVYVASENASAVAEFARNTSTGALTYDACVGEVGGCTSRANVLHVVGSLAVSPDGTSVYAGAEGGALSTFTRDTANGALTYAGCIGYLSECAKPTPQFAVNEPLSVVVSPDGANVYAGNFNNDVVDEFSREPATGVLTFTGCEGHYAEEPAACATPPAGVPEGPLQIALSPDGADLYVASEASVSEFSREAGGALSYAGCTGDVPGACTTTEPEEALSFSVSLALSPNGANLYDGAQLAKDVDVFGRQTVSCSDVTATVPYGTPTGLTLICSDTAGNAVSYSIASNPAHGTLGTVAATGQVTYTPDAGYSGPDSFTFTASNADGTAAPATAQITVGQTPAGAPANQASTSVPKQTAAELALACTTRKLTLTDVIERGSRVLLDGAAEESLVGKRVKIIFDGHSVASAVVNPNGLFSTTAPLPPAKIRNSNRARYLAEYGEQQSLDLKLTRRLILEPPTSAAGKVTLTGEVSPPLAKPVAAIVVQQQVSCTKVVDVERIKPRASGRFSVTVKSPPLQQAAIYRLTTTVRENTRSRKSFATFSLPEAVELG